MGEIVSQSDLRPTAFLSVPFLDYASVLVSSGLLTERYRNSKPIASNLGSWSSRVGASVEFPVKLMNGGTELRLRAGVIEHVSDGLKVKTVEGSDARRFTRIRNVQPRWLSSVRLLNGLPDIERQKRGSLLAENIDALDLLLGESGSEELVRRASRECLIIDGKKRVKDESKQSISLSRLGVADTTQHLLFRDLVRLDSEGPVAMVDTSCIRVSSEPEPGWPAAIISGSLNFLKAWDDCDSPLRVVLISPSENSYSDAIEFANEIYFQRHEANLDVPPGLLAAKPASIDVQLMFSDQ